MDTNELKIGQIINNAGKIGVIDDVFKNEKGEAWIVFSSAETIVRSPFESKTSEFIPFVPHSTKEASLQDFVEDVGEKIESTKNSFPERIKNGIEMFARIIGDIGFAASGDEPYLLLFCDSKQCLVETVMQEKKLVYHPKLLRRISREEAVKMATKKYGGLVSQTTMRLFDFEIEVIKKHEEVAATKESELRLEWWWCGDEVCDCHQPVVYKGKDVVETGAIDSCPDRETWRELEESARELCKKYKIKYIPSPRQELLKPVEWW